MEDEAAEAAERAGVEVRQLYELAEMAEAASLLAKVWGEPEGCEPVPANLLSALALSGCYVAGAYDGERVLVGASAAWASPSPRAELHSHITGVDPTRHSKGVGRALKLHQRRWAKEHSLSAIVWTFDPLVRRNAAFNLRTLGATVERYLVNAYGSMADALNAGGESDRLLVRWEVSRPAGSLQAAAVPPADQGLADGSALVVATPENIETLRREDPESAARWRLELRQQLAPALERGGRVSAFTPEGSYVVTPAPPTGREP